MNEARLTLQWETGKGTALKMPHEFSNLFQGVEGDIPLQFQDDKGRKFPVLYNHQRNEIPLSSLISWVRNYEPRSGTSLIIELINQEGRLFHIALTEKESAKPKDGLFLGKQKDILGRFSTDRDFYLPLQDLVTHVFICGVTGSGKTVMGKAIIEEAILNHIPSVIVDLKGDLSSLPLVFSKLEPDEFAPWISSGPDVDRPALIRSQVDQHREKLASFGLSPEDVARLKDKASFAVFTPKVGKGIPLAIASPLAAPPDVKQLLETEPATVLNMADSYSATFVRTLFPDQKLSKLKKYIAYLQEIVRLCWEKEIPLEGQAGLGTVQELILHPPIQKIGGMNLEDFIPDKSRKELASHVAMCLSGAGQLWFKGVPMDIGAILSRPVNEAVPISIINLSELTSFDDQMHAVSHLSYALYHWVRRQGDSAGMPRLLFFIDEIGGGGGRNAFFPSYPYDPPSKPGLNLLLRQGRTFGLCCIFATQNPGDVDYKGLSNCQTWMVGRLQTKRDRDKIIQGMSAAELLVGSVDGILKDIQPGEFLVKPRSGDARVVAERWLMSYHKTLTEAQVASINDPNITGWFQKKYI